ncbi:bis(5'-nucleosyl)-tetraphosphatase [asymmetrical] [Neodiprion pinetum]|uniref:Bis(5'-nucleosyl)-tetraphosphatase [asymmetrical] n=1 Tax=Neodiprion lecontei TaxID=441921 RepID=A0A6J0BG14_NEOLC|nr:bis(5'-nucleosyl)-tetraphosphatase [asymmetrical] [Neodiprion lecontei]XP_046417711.1 bis(5'-nucleosyl)-tetraphosphatase [asymmetrical] [Neodiprion fabricii]XP_046472249.1 bis(5'-nucleosyl)-tetraphosphatase [asymmetrical] [Neodiprion pinetum]XP_046612303.1 bis(5'-nucleosyl)-tetraphosphatase [asymmetrical] [Neodiprion virginianus]
MAPPRACGFVIFRRFFGQVEYLLMQTSYGIHHWTPPKGHVDPGETDLQTALRETEEEAGLSREDLKIFDNARQELVYNVNDKPKTVIYWLAELINRNKDARLSSEHQEFRWLCLQDACRLAGYEEMQNTLKYFDRYIVENEL